MAQVLAPNIRASNEYRIVRIEILPKEEGRMSPTARTTVGSDHLFNSASEQIDHAHPIRCDCFGSASLAIPLLRPSIRGPCVPPRRCRFFSGTRHLFEMITIDQPPNLGEHARAITAPYRLLRA